MTSSQVRAQSEKNWDFPRAEKFKYTFPKGTSGFDTGGKPHIGGRVHHSLPEAGKQQDTGRSQALLPSQFKIFRVSCNIAVSFF